MSKQVTEQKTVKSSRFAFSATTAGNAVAALALAQLSKQKGCQVLSENEISNTISLGSKTIPVYRSTGHKKNG